MKFLFDGKSIRKGKDIIKKKNRDKGKGTRQGWNLQNDYRL
jgi:hypothetical protein